MALGHESPSPSHPEHNSPQVDPLNPTMHPLVVQPTFQLKVPTSCEETVTRMRQAIQEQALSDTEYAGQCFDFKTSPREQRFWSPHLSVQVSESDSGSELHGRFSPRPEIWTAFVAMYAVVAFGILAASIFGYVQWFMGSIPWALLIVPIGLLSILGLHATSLMGQRLSSDQMHRLRQKLDQTLLHAKLR